jgi:hypothetical protein
MFYVFVECLQLLSSLPSPICIYFGCSFLNMATNFESLNIRICWLLTGWCGLGLFLQKLICQLIKFVVMLANFYTLTRKWAFSNCIHLFLDDADGYCKFDNSPSSFIAWKVKSHGGKLWDSITWVMGAWCNSDGSDGRKIVMNTRKNKISPCFHLFF